MGKIILNLAISLDGYIADNEDKYDWITGHGDNHSDTENSYSFSDFLSGIDVVVMGNRCYNLGFAKDYTNKKVYVATHTEQEDQGNISFIGGHIVDTILKERDAGKNIYLFGGGILIQPFIKANVIDEYIIGIIPVVLGQGIPLFPGNTSTIPLHLDSHSISDGVTILCYSKRVK